MGDTDLLVLLPSAHLEPCPAQVQITIREAGRPLPGVDVLALFPNHTWLRSSSDTEGVATFSLYTTDLPMTVYAAAKGYAANVERDWIPSQRALAIELQKLPAGGSVIYPEGTGALPGIAGRLNPIRDTHDRTYLYASNVAVNQGAAQPVSFLLGEELRLSDAKGVELWARFIDIAGRSALIQYRPVVEDHER